MTELELRYVAHITTLTNKVKERYAPRSPTLRGLVDELEVKYKGFSRVFVDSETGGLKLNAMIYYSDTGQTPEAIIDLDHPIKDGAKVIFW
jgi:molybdopterin converting factor small subunit